MNPIKHPDLGKNLTGRVIGAAMTVHRKFGPGLDEADYEKALSLELHALGIAHECQVSLPLLYKGTKLDCGFRMDLILPGLLLELKALDKLHPLHEAQLLTYLRLSNLPLGLPTNLTRLLGKSYSLSHTSRQRRSVTPDQLWKPAAQRFHHPPCEHLSGSQTILSFSGFALHHGRSLTNCR